MRGQAWHGVGWTYAHIQDGRTAARLRCLTTPPVELDALGVAQAWGQRPILDPGRTIVRDVRRVPPPLAAVDEGAPLAFDVAFDAAVARLAARSERPVLALGGGLDAAAVLVAWRRAGAPLPTVATLQTGLVGYDEVEAARATCRNFGVPLQVVDISEEVLRAAVLPAVLAVETPLYNLHPVSRYALASALRERGHDALVTGDGADAIFAGAPDHDYVPLVASMTEAAGLRLSSPFLDARVVAAACPDSTPDPSKGALRAYVSRHAGPRWLSRLPKRPRSMPALPRRPEVATEVLASVARRLDRPMRLDDDRARVGWTTLALLVANWDDR
jgi:asparagine synthetase B (glutamine-hydrolysing)